MDRVGVFGGSFDPPHIGHAMAISWLLWTKQVDHIILVPAYRHAFGKASSPWEQRFNWCMALSNLFPWGSIRVSPIEATLPVPSFTIHTLEALKAKYPTADLHLIVGTDIKRDTPKWHQWERIERDFAPIWVNRGGYETIPGCPEFPSVSSTLVRDLLSQGDVEGASKWVPKAILDLLPKDPEFWKR